MPVLQLDVDMQQIASESLSCIRQRLPKWRTMLTGLSIIFFAYTNMPMPWTQLQRLVREVIGIRFGNMNYAGNEVVEAALYCPDATGCRALVDPQYFLRVNPWFGNEW